MNNTDNLLELQSIALPVGITVYRALHSMLPRYELRGPNNLQALTDPLAFEPAKALLKFLAQQPTQPNHYPDYTTLCEWYLEEREDITRSSLWLLAKERANRHRFQISPYGDTGRHRIERDGLVHLTFTTPEELNAFMAGFEVTQEPVRLYVTVTPTNVTVTTDPIRSVSTPVA